MAPVKTNKTESKRMGWYIRGTSLPDGSYWFVAHYKGENNENKELRGYFALKR